MPLADFLAHRIANASCFTRDYFTGGLVALPTLLTGGPGGKSELEVELPKIRS
jgi:hypothetical protein